MAITVQNITSTSATVSWPLSYSCLDSFYRIMYHPHWNSLLMGYTRKNMLRQDMVPASQTTASLGNLSPQTTYILCVTCQSANPSRGQCQIFDTLGGESTELGTDGQRDLPIGIWLACNILLLLIASILLCSCLHSWCRWSRDPPDGGSANSSLPQNQCQSDKGNGESKEDVGHLYCHKYSPGESQLATTIENPFSLAESTSLSERDPELVPLDGQSNKKSPSEDP